MRRIMIRWGLLSVLFLGYFHGSLAEGFTQAQWIWYPEQASTDARNAHRYFRKCLVLEADPEKAFLWIQVDDKASFWVNGDPLSEPDARRGGCAGFDLLGRLKKGRNVLAVDAFNATSVAGVIAKIILLDAEAREITFYSDSSWRVHSFEVPGWRSLDFDDSVWMKARELGDAFMLPWSQYDCYDTSAVVSPEERASRDAAIERLLADPAQFAQEKPVQASIGHVNGSVVVTINGEKRPAVFYRATVDPFTKHGRRQISQFAQAGIHLFCPYFHASRCWKAPGLYDFSSLDEGLRAYLTADRKAFFVPIIRLVPPNWWMEAHEEEWVRYAKTDLLDSGDEARNVKRASLASDARAYASKSRAGRED